MVIEQILYSYDLYNCQIAQTVNLDGAGNTPSTKEQYVYDGDNMALVFDGQGNNLKERYLFGAQVDQVLAEEQGKVLWILTDSQGTVRDVVDSNGVVQNNLNYDSFGNITSETNPVKAFSYYVVLPPSPRICKNDMLPSKGRMIFMNKKFEFEFEDTSPSSSILFEYDELIDEKINVVLEKNIPVVYANKQALLSIAKTFIKLSMCDYANGFHIHFTKDLLGEEIEILRVTLEN
jgi:hypothetical protein